MPHSSSLKLSANGALRRVVIKLGTGVLTSGVGQLDTSRIAAVCAEIATLRAAGTEVIIVSSGAVGLGMGVLQLERRPKELARKQACAAIGQSRLMQTWQNGFTAHRLTVAQVLHQRATTLEKAKLEVIVQQLQLSSAFNRTLSLNELGGEIVRVVNNEIGCEFEKTPPWNVLLLFG